MDYQPMMHQLYEEELFPELEFSRKFSENSQLMYDFHNDSLPILDSDDEDGLKEGKPACADEINSDGGPGVCATSV